MKKPNPGVQNRRTTTTHANRIIGDVTVARENARLWHAIQNTQSTIRKEIDSSRASQNNPLRSVGMGYFRKKRETAEAAFQDLKMIQAIARTMTRPMVVDEICGPSSINSTRLKKEVNRIAKENRAFVRRLETVLPQVHTAEQMHKEFEDQQRHLINCSYSARINLLYPMMRQPDRLPFGESNQDGSEDEPGEEY